MATVVRFVYKNMWRKGRIINYTTQHPQYPAANTQDDMRSLVWRSRHGTDSGNGLWVIDATCNKIDFIEGINNYTATLTNGSYTANSLRGEIIDKMRAVGTYGYQCSYNEAVGAFTIFTSPANTFGIKFASGANPGTNIHLPCGFDNVDHTGQTSYASDYPRFHYPAEYVDIDLGAAYPISYVGLLNHNITADAEYIQAIGSTVPTFDAAVKITNITHNTNNAHEYFPAAITKRYWRIYVSDYANSSGFVQIGTIVLGKYFQPKWSYGLGHEDGFGDLSAVELSDSLNLFADEKPRYKILTLPFEGMNDSSIAEVKLMQEECGTHKGIIVCLDSDNPNSFSYWMRMSELGLPSRHVQNHWTWTANLEELL